MTMTGKTRHRLSRFGKKLILQVEKTYIREYNMGGYIDNETYADWFDATF